MENIRILYEIQSKMYCLFISLRWKVRNNFFVHLMVHYLQFNFVTAPCPLLNENTFLPSTLHFVWKSISSAWALLVIIITQKSTYACRWLLTFYIINASSSRSLLNSHISGIVQPIRTIVYVKRCTWSSP